jgi:carboxylesterase
MQLIMGAEPWSHIGSVDAGVVCLHGFTGNPGSMRGVARAFADAGFHVELPRLPGHGTTIEDMMTTGWSDWTGEADAAFERLSGRVSKVIVAGLSMGGALTLWLGTKHPNITGLVCVNAVATRQPDEVIDMVQGMLDEGTATIPGIGSDIADPDVKETAYESTPLAPFLSLMAGLGELQHGLGAIRCPVFIMNSLQDHVVEPSNSDHIAASVSGRVDRVRLQRSYHVATLDYDRNIIEFEAVEFAREACGL